MFDERTLLWMFVPAVCLVVSWLFWDTWSAARARRQRRRRYRQIAMSQPQPLASRPVPLPGIVPAEAERIRVDAENAARLAFLFPEVKPTSPWRQGSPENVLWVTTYHLTMAELQDAGADAGVGRGDR